MNLNTIEAIEKQIKELQKQLEKAKKAHLNYEGQYIVDRQEELYMKVKKVKVDEDGDTYLIGDCVCLNEDDFYVTKDDEINLDWKWIKIELSSKEEYEEAVEKFALGLKKFL